MRKQYRYALIFVLLFLLCWPISYLTVRNSAPFKAAASFVRASPTVKSELGDVASVGLAPLGYVTGLGFSNEPAFLDLKVVGNNSRGTVEIDMENANGTWRVTKARLLTQDNRKVELRQ